MNTTMFNAFAEQANHLRAALRDLGVNSGTDAGLIILLMDAAVAQDHTLYLPDGIYLWHGVVLPYALTRNTTQDNKPAYVLLLPGGVGIMFESVPALTVKAVPPLSVALKDLFNELYTTIGETNAI